MAQKQTEPEAGGGGREGFREKVSHCLGSGAILRTLKANEVKKPVRVETCQPGPQKSMVGLEC